MTTPLRFAARHGRLLLVLGLIGGFALPDLASAMKPWLPQMVAVLIFVSALRIGARAALGNLAEPGQSLRLVGLLQLAVPLVAIAIFAGFGWHGSLFAMAAILALSGSSISGSPAFTVMVGHAPEQALRLLILGTALLPITIIPVFWLTPGLGGAWEVALAALRLSVVIALAVAAAFTLRRIAFPDPTPETTQALDGLSAITLSIIVIALMSAVGPVVRTDPMQLLPWLTLCFAVNFGQQIALHLCGASPAASIVAGNRNIALYLVALPVSVTDPLLPFIGCYQIPMYLTPILMKPFYNRG